LLKEIRIHGRGGQGAVTTGQILAIAAFYDGKQTQTFPMFGVERAGAPVQAFVRLSEKQISLRSQIYEPDIVLVLEPTLIEAVNVLEGLKKGGTVIVNTNKSKEELNLGKDYTVHTIDATTIALKIFKKPIVNTAVLGSFSALTKMVSLKSLKKAIDDVFLNTKGKKIAELNKTAIEEVYKAAK